MLDRLFATASLPAAANDAACARTSLLVNRRNRERRRDAR